VYMSPGKEFLHGLKMVIFVVKISFFFKLQYFELIFTVVKTEMSKKSCVIHFRMNYRTMWSIPLFGVNCITIVRSVFIDKAG
jgi:hypothetical protein